MDWLASYWYLFLISMIVCGGGAIYFQLRNMRGMLSDGLDAVNDTLEGVNEDLTTDGDGTASIEGFAKGATGFFGGFFARAIPSIILALCALTSFILLVVGVLAAIFG